MADITIAVGAPINYRVDGGLPNCSYRVMLIRNTDNKIVDIRQITTGSNGSAVATFVHAAVGSYTIQAQGLNCGRCPLPCKSVEVILDCSVANTPGCNPCCGPSATCSMNWNIMPKSFVAGIATNTSYTANGVANCRLKILFFDGDTPVQDGVNGQLFTYITSGVPVNPTLTWPGAVIGRDYNWRPAPISEQDPCLQNCTISPDRIDIDITAGSGNCSITWNLQPRAVAQTEFATLSVSGATPNCPVRFGLFTSVGAPILDGGGIQRFVEVQINSSGEGSLFVGPCTDAGELMLKPLTGSLQSPCASGCTFDLNEAILTCGTTTPSAIPVATDCLDVSGTLYHRLVWTINPAKVYQLQLSTNGGITFTNSGSTVTGSGSLTYTSPPSQAGYVVRLKNNTDTVYSSAITTIDCSAAPSANWYCVGGNCVQAGVAPPNSTGPFTSANACNTACGTPNNGTYAITLADQFSPGAGACANVPNTSVYWEQGTYHAATLIVNGGPSSAVNITGLPAWITRTNNSGSITLAGTPPSTTPFNITVAAPGCTFTWANIVSGGCDVTWSMSPTTFTHDVNTSVTYSATGPSGCFVKIGSFYDSSPVLDGFGQQVTISIPCGSSITTSNNWPLGAVGNHFNWRVVGGQLPCLAGCNVTPQQINITIT